MTFQQVIVAMMGVQYTQPSSNGTGIKERLSGAWRFAASWPPGEKSLNSTVSHESRDTARCPKAVPGLGPLSGSHEVTGDAPLTSIKPRLILLGWGRPYPYTQLQHYEPGRLLFAY